MGEINQNNKSIKYMSHGDEDMSYSVFLEKRNSIQKLDEKDEEKEEFYVVNNGVLEKDPLKYTLPRRVYTWVDDSMVSCCYKCNVLFSFMIRKHHCRFCGRIFCYNCCNNFTYVPEELLSEDSKKGTWNEYIGSYLSEDNGQKYRVCQNCLEMINMVSSVKKVVEVFIICNLNIEELKKASRISKVWQNAGNYILSIFREIQHKLPTDRYSDLEIKLLWTNAKYTGGHSKYLSHLMKTCDTQEQLNMIINLITKRKIIDCWSMLCTRNCITSMGSFDAINILFHCFNKQNKKIEHNKTVNDELKKIALNHLKCDDIEMKCYIPILVYYFRYDENDILKAFLINRCFGNFKLLNSLYWELEMYKRDEKDMYHGLYIRIADQLRSTLTTKGNDALFIDLLKSVSYVNAIIEVSNNMTDVKKREFPNELVFSLNPELRIKSIDNKNIVVKNSFTKPLVVPCITTSDVKINVLYKKENVRKDQIIMNIIRIIDIILRKYKDLSMGLVYYEVLPIDKNSGLIEIIDDCDTIYHIQEKLKATILNYILENNGHMTIKEVRDRFIKTTATYCVITYLLGVGDRHMDNIMVTKDGRLFHIDFGYILGKDPVVSNNSGIRITPEIIDALGGLNSIYYRQFTELCTEIYNCLRRNVDILMTMLLILPKISNITLTEDEIKEQVLKRFIPGGNDIDAKLHLVSKLEQQSYIDRVKDWCHYHNKEQTISHSVSTVTSTLSTNISNFWNKK